MDLTQSEWWRTGVWTVCAVFAAVALALGGARWWAYDGIYMTCIAALEWRHARAAAR